MCSGTCFSHGQVAKVSLNHELEEQWCPLKSSGQWKDRFRLLHNSQKRGQRRANSNSRALVRLDENWCVYFINDLPALFSLEQHAWWIIPNKSRNVNWKSKFRRPAERNSSGLAVKQMYCNLAAVSGAVFGSDGVMLRFEFSFWAWGDGDRRRSSTWSFICFLSPPPHICVVVICSDALSPQKRQPSRRPFC